jgi:hypothetical protein
MASSSPRPNESLRELAGSPVPARHRGAILADSVLMGLAASLILVGLLRPLHITSRPSLALALLAGLCIPAVCGAWLVSTMPRRQLPKRAIAAVAASLITALALAHVPDTSWDGMAYHFPSVMRIAAGWNPWLGPTDVAPANLYPNGAWTLMAAAGLLLGSLDAGRIVKLMVLVAAAALVLRLLFVWIERPQSRRLLTFAVVANPVVMAQIWTFYLDDLIYLLTLCCFCQSVGPILRLAGLTNA